MSKNWCCAHWLPWSGRRRHPGAVDHATESSTIPTLLYLHCIYTIPTLLYLHCISSSYLLLFLVPFYCFLVLSSVAFRSLYRFYTFRYFFTTFHNVSLLFTTFTLKGTKIHLRPSCVFRRLGPMPPTPSATTPSYGKNCSVLSL